MNPARKFPLVQGKLWSVYLMAAPFAFGITYFKVGISQDVIRRIKHIQTGCPMEITDVWEINATFNGSAQALEKELHERLKEHHSFGEWFALSMEDDKHKADLNAAMEYARQVCSQMIDEKWRRLDIAGAREALRLEMRKKLESVRKKQNDARMEKFRWAHNGN